MLGDESLIIYKGEEAHYELAVHPIGHTAVARMESPKSLILKVRLSPEAKKPPKGAMSEAKEARTMEWKCMGSLVKEKVVPSGRKKR